jgi:hypothetical protein
LSAGYRGCPLDVAREWHEQKDSADAMSGRLWLPATNLIAKS